MAMVHPPTEEDKPHRVPNRAMRRQAARGYGKCNPKRSRIQRKR